MDPVEHAVPDRTGGLRPVAALALTGLLAAPVLAAALAVPRFERIFRDFGVPLPSLSRLLIGAGRIAREPAVLAMLLLACAAAGFAAAWSAGRRPRLLALWFTLAAAWLLLALVAMAVALLVPLSAMIESLQQGGAP